MGDDWLAEIAKSGKPDNLDGLRDVGAKVGHQHDRRTGTVDKIQDNGESVI